MALFIASRLLQFVPTLLLVSVAVFLLVRAIPGDAAYVLLGPTARPEQIEALRLEMGLDEPIWRQYVIWIRSVLSGDLGHSWINRFPVAELVRQKAPATIALALSSMIVSLAISLPAGVLSALNPSGLIARFVHLYTSLALAIPTFWLGVLMVLVFSLRLGWVPPSGYVAFTEDPLRSLELLLLPSITLGVYLSAIFTRFIKSSIGEVLDADYVRTAKAKGLAPPRVVTAHVLRNALIPVVTMLGIQFGGLLGGAVIVEAVFDIPGLGRLLVTSISSRDYAVVQGTILLAATTFLVVNLITDLTYGFLDPRIRERGY